MDNPADMLLRNAEYSTDHTLPLACPHHLYNRRYIGFGQFGVVIALATLPVLFASFSCRAVLDILLLRPGVQMRWVHAWRVVTMVEHGKPLGDGPLMHLVR